MGGMLRRGSLQSGRSRTVGATARQEPAVPRTAHRTDTPFRAEHIGSLLRPAEVVQARANAIAQPIRYTFGPASG